MQYLLMICRDEGAEPDPDFDMAAATEAWVKEMDGRGVRLLGNRLRPVDFENDFWPQVGRSFGPTCAVRTRVVGASFGPTC